jgi:hypothetical protein
MVMNEPTNLKRFEKQLKDAEAGDKQALSFIKLLLISFLANEKTSKGEDVSQGAILAMGRAVLEYNRDEWREWQRRHQ